MLRGIHFEFNKSNIRPEDEPVLDEAVDTLKAHPNVAIYVSGYCDAVGSDEYSQKLSERRAAAVAKYLEGKGIVSSRLIARGFGKTNFVAYQRHGRRARAEPARRAGARQLEGGGCFGAGHWLG